MIRHPDNESVNVLFLFGFAGGNALVDIICSILFYLRRKDVLLNSSQGNTSRMLQDETPQRAKAEGQKDNESINLNMASALTHVSGDSLRTSSVFIAAVVATLTSYKGALCDAWAALAVTVTIVFIVIPLVNEIYQHAKSHPFFNSRGSEIV